LNKCAVFFHFGRLGDKDQHVTNFIDDDFDIVKLWINMLLNIADEDDDAANESVFLATYAAQHSFNATKELIILLDNLSLSDVSARLVSSARDIAAAAAEAVVTAVVDQNIPMAKKCVHVAASAARIVACVYACDIAKISIESPNLSIFRHTPDILFSDDRASFIIELNKEVIDITMAALAAPSTKSRQGTNRNALDDQKRLKRGGASIMFGHEIREKHNNRTKNASAIHSRRLRRRKHYSIKRRTLKNKNIPRTCRRNFRCIRRSYSRKIGNNNNK
jgi:hypothetical protein